MTQAMNTIQSDAAKIANITLPSAIEACDWLAVHRLSEQLIELASRGMHRASIEKVSEVGRFAMNGFSERDCH